MKLVLVLMALVAIAAIAQNRWDRLTAEEKQLRALNYIVGGILFVAVGLITLIMI
jgi:threonine/homoserine/homoserine lactone efflux protein